MEVSRGERQGRSREWKKKLKNPGLPNRNFSWSFIPVCNYSFFELQCYSSVLLCALDIQEHVTWDTQGNDQ